MATLITVTKTTPSTITLSLSATDGTVVYLLQSGATGNNKDLSALAVGPLQTMLARSTNWTTLLPGKIIIRRIFTAGSAYATPVSASTAVDWVIAPTTYSSVPAFSFGAAGAASVAAVEIAFAHSLAR